MLGRAQVQKNMIGTVSPQKTEDVKTYLSDISRLDEVVQIFKVDEVIFCSQDVSSENIMQWMTHLGAGIDYKIVPKESISIIGSSSKNAAGELYTIDIQYKVSSPMARRNKRVLDILLAIGFLPATFILVFFVKHPFGLIRNIFQVMAGKKTWVGYSAGSFQFSAGNQAQPLDRPALLPKLRKGVLSPLDELGQRDLDGSHGTTPEFFVRKGLSCMEGSGDYKEGVQVFRAGIRRGMAVIAMPPFSLLRQSK